MSSGLSFYGLWHLGVGNTVSAWVVGLDCGDYVVDANGSIFVPYQSDPGELFTSAYWQTFDDSIAWGIFGVSVQDSNGRFNTIPVLIGGTYTSNGQILPPDSEQEAKTHGSAMGELRRHHQIAAKLPYAISQTVSFGTDLAGTLPLLPAKLTGPNDSTDLGYATPFEGVYWTTVTDAHNRGVFMPSWQITRPYPFIISAITGFIDTSEI